MSDKPEDVREDGGEGHLGQPLISPELAAALEKQYGKLDEAAESQQARARLIGEARSLGLIGDDETGVTDDEVRRRIEDYQVRQAEEARTAIAGSGDADMTGEGEADPAATTQSAERAPRRERDDKGRPLYPSKYNPELNIARMRTGDRDDIAVLLQWYSDRFEDKDLTKQQALHLLMDARTQGLYSWNGDTGERTPIQVRDEELRGRVAELFGEGTESEGRAEAVYQWLRAQEGQSQSGSDSETGRRRWRLEELRDMVGSLEQQIYDLNQSDPDSVEGWREILDAFILEEVLYYDDEAEGEAKGRVASNVRNSDLRKKAWNLFREAERHYLAARKKVEKASGGAQAAEQTQDPEVTASAEKQGDEPRQWTREELERALGEFEQQINELTRNDPNSIENWRRILDGFYRQGLLIQGSKNQADAVIKSSELRERGNRLFREARSHYVAALKRAGIATTAREAARHHKKPWVRPFDEDDADREETAGDAVWDEINDPHGLHREELERPPEFRVHTYAPGPPAQEAQAASEPAITGEQDRSDQLQDTPPEHPLVTRGVEKVRREWERAIRRERDEHQRRRMQGMMQDEINFERDRITAELRRENERERRERLRRPGA